MKPLQKIGMQKGWTYEVIVSTFGDDGPHSAPMGVWTDDLAVLSMDIYTDGRTLKNIMDLKELAVNFVDDAVLFHDSLFHCENLEFRDSTNIRAPLLSKAPAVVEAGLLGVEKKGGRFRVHCRPVHIVSSGPVKLINRAEALVVEGLILSTRLPYLGKAKVRDALREYCRVVKKVAPGSEYERIMEELVAALPESSSDERPG